MIDSGLQAELLQRVGGLPLPLQQRVLAYARELERARSAPTPGTPGRDLLKFAGTLSRKEADEMMKVIEEGCEQISNDW